MKWCEKCNKFSTTITHKCQLCNYTTYEYNICHCNNSTDTKIFLKKHIHLSHYKDNVKNKNF